MGDQRWARLRDSLTASGIETKVDERAYSEAVRGRVQHGVSRSITLRLGGGALVEVNDTWWRKNPDVWTGWSVTLSGTDSIVRTRRSGMKRRSEVVVAVTAALNAQAVA